MKQRQEEQEIKKRYFRVHSTPPRLMAVLLPALGIAKLNASGLSSVRRENLKKKLKLKSSNWLVAAIVPVGSEAFP